MSQQRARLRRVWYGDAPVKRALLLVPALLLVALATMAEPPAGVPAKAKPKPVRPRALPQSAEWAGQQSIAADRKGRVFLLSTARFEVFPLTSGGELGEPQKLERLADSDREMILLNATMSADGRRWLAQDFASPRGLVLFVNGKEKVLPATGWLPTGVGFAGDDPLFAASAMQMGENLGPAERGEPPFLRVLSGSAWKTISTEPIEAQSPMELMTTVKDSREVLFARGAESSFWVVQRHVYRLRRLSSAGRQLEEVRLGEGRVEYRDPSKAEQERLDKFGTEAAKSGHILPSGFGKGQKAKRVLEAAATGPDGRLYLLVSAEANEGSTAPALDRYDPTTGLLQRVDLQLEEPIRRSTMAAGRDGLLVVAEPANGGRWFLSWETLEAAEWREVPNARVGVKFDD